jgi:hypothetical protein
MALLNPKSPNFKLFSLSRKTVQIDEDISTLSLSERKRLNAYHFLA